jgi:predicted ATP-dependent endonuclease of OLD family
MSDGTLRILALLLSVFQHGENRVILIEEPESTVHPAITEMLTDVFLEASKDKQVVMTTHSPDLLDYKEIQDDQVLMVQMDRGKTIISPIAESSRKLIRQSLFTVGELLRTDELYPDLKMAQSHSSSNDIYQLDFTVDDEG